MILPVMIKHTPPAARFTYDSIPSISYIIQTETNLTGRQL
jgi:hypothetical protein